MNKVAFEKRVILFISKWGLPLLIASLLVVGAFALHDIANSKSGAVDGGIGYWNAILHLLGASGQGDWAGTFTFLLNVTLAWAALKVYVEAFGLRWDHFKARWLVNEHIVIVAGQFQAAEYADSVAGASESASLGLAADFALTLASRHTVVFAAPQVPQPQRSQLWAAGVITVEKDLDIIPLLKATRAKTSAQLFAMRENLGENVSVVRGALSGGSAQTRFMCLIKSLDERRAFRLDDVFEPETQHRIRVFNEAELIARRFLCDHPPDAPVATSDDQQAHILLVGLGSVGSALIFELFRVGHYRSYKPPRLSIISEDATARWACLVQATPSLVSRWLEVTTLDGRIENMTDRALGEFLSGGPPVTVAYVCTKNELVNLRGVKRLQSHFSGPWAQRLATGASPRVVALDPPGGTLLADSARSKKSTGIFSISVTRSQGSSALQEAQMLQAAFSDEQAASFHARYLDHEQLKPEFGSMAAHRSWEDLEEGYREDNRLRPEFLAVLLRSIGCEEVDLADPRLEAVITREEGTRLAVLEHHRWWAAKELSGWSFAPKTLRHDLKHEDMRPFNELNLATQDRDRIQVEAMLGGVRKRGRKIVRQSVQGCDAQDV